MVTRTQGTLEYKYLLSRASMVVGICLHVLLSAVSTSAASPTTPTTIRLPIVASYVDPATLSTLTVVNNGRGALAIKIGETNERIFPDDTTSTWRVRPGTYMITIYPYDGPCAEVEEQQEYNTYVGDLTFDAGQPVTIGTVCGPGRPPGGGYDFSLSIEPHP